MAFDLILRRGLLRGREQEGPLDLGVVGTRIALIAPRIEAEGRELDAGGQMVAPTFIDPHVHLDKALIAETVRDNASGTLTEAIEIIWERKRHYQVAEIVERATRVVEWAVGHGTTVIRTHVDVDSIGGLVPLEAILALRKQVADLVDLQVVAFPQEGILQDPGTERLLEQAMEMGADVVGGMPYNERSPEASRRHIELCFELARRFDADLDMHVDETDDPGARTLAMLADATIANGWEGRVTAGHTCALAAYPDPYAAKVIGLVQRAGIHMVTNPATNLMLQGRYDRQPIRRGITRVKELLAAGVNVSFGQDCLKDTFYPTFGQADMLEVGLITAHAAQLSMPREVEVLFDMATRNAAKMLGVADYGLEVGCRASFNLLACSSVQEAFRTRPERVVVRDGRVVAESRRQSTLHRQEGPHPT